MQLYRGFESDFIDRNLGQKKTLKMNPLLLAFLKWPPGSSFESLNRCQDHWTSLEADPTGPGYLNSVILDNI